MIRTLAVEHARPLPTEGRDQAGTVLNRLRAARRVVVELRVAQLVEQHSECRAGVPAGRHRAARPRFSGRPSSPIAGPLDRRDECEQLEANVGQRPELVERVVVVQPKQVPADKPAPVAGPSRCRLGPRPAGTAAASVSCAQRSLNPARKLTTSRARRRSRDRFAGGDREMQAAGECERDREGERAADQRPKAAEEERVRPPAVVVERELPGIDALDDADDSAESAGDERRHRGGPVDREPGLLTPLISCVLLGSGQV